MKTSLPLFDDKAYDLHQHRAKPHFSSYSFLYDHIAQNLIARKNDFQQPFKHILTLSPHPLPIPSSTLTTLERHLPYADESFDVVFSCLQAHWANDLSRYLAEVYRVLEPGGLFLGALWGGSTLYELRESFLKGELAHTGGATPRVSPMIHPPDATQLLSRAGFINTVVDTEILKVTYSSLTAIMKDLRGMGESNKLTLRMKNFTSRGLLKKVEGLYKQAFQTHDGHLICTFEGIYLSGRKPIVKLH